MERFSIRQQNKYFFLELSGFFSTKIKTFPNELQHSETIKFCLSFLFFFWFGVCNFKHPP